MPDPRIPPADVNRFVRNAFEMESMAGRSRRVLCWVLAAGCSALVACGGGGSDSSAGNPQPSSSSPTITSFAASPATLSSGQSAQLAWIVTGATTLALDQGIGDVTGQTTRTIAPPASTTYTLTAGNGAGSVSAQVRVTVNPFVVNDQPIGDPNISYVQIELSPDMRFMTWIEDGAGLSGASVAWLCALDRDNGTLIPANGRGVRIADIRNQGSPQWGQDATGYYSVTIDTDGRFVVARPSLNPDGTAAGAITRLTTAANRTRAYPYPSRIAVPGGYLVYLQDDPAVAGRQQLWWLNLASPATENQITQGPVASIGQFGLPPYLVNIQRWFYDTASLANGIPAVTYGYTPANPGGQQPLTLEQLDFTSGTPPLASRVMGVSPQVLDPFPFFHQGERYAIGGLNFGPVGIILRRDATGLFATEVQRIETTGSALANPSNFASAEPFFYKGQLYTAYQLNEPGAPGTTNGEIFITGLLGNTTRRMVSDATPSRRADPEVLIGRDRVWILYYARTGVTSRWTLRRADTGL